MSHLVGTYKIVKITNGEAIVRLIGQPIGVIGETYEVAVNGDVYTLTDNSGSKPTVNSFRAGEKFDLDLGHGMKVKATGYVDGNKVKLVMKFGAKELTLTTEYNEKGGQLVYNLDGTEATAVSERVK